MRPNTSGRDGPRVLICSWGSRSSATIPPRLNASVLTSVRRSGCPKSRTSLSSSRRLPSGTWSTTATASGTSTTFPPAARWRSVKSRRSTMSSSRSTSTSNPPRRRVSARRKAKASAGGKVISNCSGSARSSTRSPSRNGTFHQRPKSGSSSSPADCTRPSASAITGTATTGAASTAANRRSSASAPKWTRGEAMTIASASARSTAAFICSVIARRPRVPVVR